MDAARRARTKWRKGGILTQEEAVFVLKFLTGQGYQTSRFIESIMPAVVFDAYQIRFIKGAPEEVHKNKYRWAVVTVHPEGGDGPLLTALARLERRPERRAAAD